MIIETAWMLLYALLTTAAPAAPIHFTDCANGTGNNATIGIRASAAMINGVPMQSGDEIAVYTPRDQCAGAGVWTGTDAIAITVWGDNELTDGVIEGFQPDEPYAFRVWQRDSDRVYVNGVNAAITMVFESGPSSYRPDAVSVVSALTVPVRKVTWGSLKIRYR